MWFIFGFFFLSVLCAVWVTTSLSDLCTVRVTTYIRALYSFSSLSHRISFLLFFIIRFLFLLVSSLVFVIFYWLSSIKSPISQKKILRSNSCCDDENERIGGNTSLPEQQFLIKKWKNWLLLFVSILSINFFNSV
jgi:hypothetical protein